MCTVSRRYKYPYEIVIENGNYVCVGYLIVGKSNRVLPGNQILLTCI